MAGCDRNPPEFVPGTLKWGGLFFKRYYYKEILCYALKEFEFKVAF